MLLFVRAPQVVLFFVRTLRLRTRRRFIHSFVYSFIYFGHTITAASLLIYIRFKNHLTVFKKYYYLFQKRIPIYEGARITYIEAKLLLLNFCVRHSVSDLGLDDLLITVNHLLPMNVFPSKYHVLMPYKTPDDFVIQYYCPNCFSLLKDQDKLVILICKTCNQEHDKKILHCILKSYIIQIPLKPQIENFVNSEK